MSPLYLIATPIGNLEDITLRALRLLAEADLILAEDTRHSGRLLQHFQIHTPLRSLHEHNEPARIPAVLDMLAQGQKVALISDAGTPTLSDPGFPLVRAAIAAGHEVTPAPGASALLAALVASGLPADRFLFLGFPPRKPAARRQWLQDVAAEPGLLILYESPHRLPALLQDAAALLGRDRAVVVAREITKLHETFWRGSLAQASAAFAQPPAGEVVVLIAGAAADHPAPAPEAVQAALRTLLAAGLSAADASRLVATLSGLPRKQVYAWAIAAHPPAPANVGQA